MRSLQLPGIYSISNSPLNMTWPIRLLLFFQVFCFVLVTIPNRQKPFERFLLFLSTVNISIGLTLLWSCYYYAQVMFDFENKLSGMVDIIQIVAPIITHVVLLLEAIYHRGTIYRLWLEFLEIFAIGGAELHQILQRVLFYFFVKVGTLQLVATAVECRILWGISGSWFRSRITAQYAFISCRSAYIFYILHADIIGGVLELIATDLETIFMEYQPRIKWRKSNRIQGKSATHRIEKNRKVLRLIFSIVQKMNVCFAWSLMFNLVNNFLSITIAFYWNYRGAYMRRLTTGESLN